MKIDPYKHEERYLEWKKSVENGIPGITKENSDIILNYINDMEKGVNIAAGSVKGARSYIRLNSLREKTVSFAKRFKERYNQGNILSKLEWISEHRDVDVEEAYQYIGNSSSVYRSYPFTVFMFQKYWDDPVNGMLDLINTGGDCDTTASMYGALVGAKSGFVFPKKWLEVCSGVEEAKDLGRKIYEIH